MQYWINIFIFFLFNFVCATTQPNTVPSTWPFSLVNWKLDDKLLQSSNDSWPIFGRQLTCSDIKKLTFTSDRLSHGSAKGVWKAKLPTPNGGAEKTIIVKRPIKGDRFERRGENETYMIDVFQREATILRNLAAMPNVMQWFGGCFDTFEKTMNFVEYVDRFGVVVQEPLGWRARLRIAIGICEMFEAFDLFHAAPLIMCDFNQRQFGVTRNTKIPKIVDVDSLLPYRKRYQSDHYFSCQRDSTHPNHGCIHGHCFPQLQEDVDLSEWQCVFDNNTVHQGYCHGFDKRTHVYAVAKLLLVDLLEKHLVFPPSKTFRASIKEILTGCLQNDASKRWSMTVLRDRLTALLHTESLNASSSSTSSSSLAKKLHHRHHSKQSRIHVTPHQNHHVGVVLQKKQSRWRAKKWK